MFANKQFPNIPRSLLQTTSNLIKQLIPLTETMRLTHSEILTKYPTVCSFRAKGRTV